MLRLVLFQFPQKFRMEIIVALFSNLSERQKLTGGSLHSAHDKVARGREKERCHIVWQAASGTRASEGGNSSCSCVAYCFNICVICF